MKFANKEALKIQGQKLIFDQTTTHLEYVDIGQYESGNNSFDGLFKVKITEVVFKTAQPNLLYLDLSYQPLKKLVIKNCPNLQKLYLYNCALEEILFEGEFPKLELIDLSKNQLREMALEKDHFPLLQYFFINGNKIRDISFLAPFMLEKEYFDFGVRGNPLPESFQDDNDWIRNFYRQQRQYGKETFYEAKIIIVGEGESGKTTFRRLLFDPDIPVPDTVDNQPSTHGIAVQQNRKFSHLHEQGVSIMTNIWDFGGQDIQYNLHHYFLSPDALYILVTDLRSEKTRFTYWFQAINFFGSENIPLIILKNEGKEDGNNDPNIEQYKRDFPMLAKNISEVRMNLAQIKTEHQAEWKHLIDFMIPQQLEKLDTVGTAGIKIWAAIRSKFETYTTPYVDFDTLFSFVRKKGMEREEDFIFMLNYFHRSGIIVYYEKDNDLNTYIFVNPNWITENLYSAITEKGIAQNGIFEEKKLFDFWSEKGINERENRNILLRLMQKEKFDVAYALPGSKYAVPILFPDKEKQYPALGNDILQFRYNFKSFLPKGLLSRFIVRMYAMIEHNDAGEDLAWKTGVLLQQKDTRALVIEHTDHKISIEIAGADKISLRSTIIHTFESLFEKYPQKPDLLIPCNCATCKNTANQPEFFTYADLLNFVSKQREIQCRASGDMIDPAKLLHGIKMLAGEKGEEGLVVNITKIDGRGNTVLQGIDGSTIDISTGDSGQDLKEAFEGIHEHLDRQDGSLAQIQQLQERTGQELAQLSDFQAFFAGKIISKIAEGQAAFFDNKKEEADFRLQVSRFIDGVREKEEAETLKALMASEGIDITSKLEFIIPFIIGSYKIEFSTKDKLPRTWKELRALFIKD